MAGADGEDVAGATLADALPQVKAAVDFVANLASSGIPASSRRSSSAAQSAGRYRARSVRACPAGDAQVRVTATWHRAIPPMVPPYWRAAPAQSVPVLASPVSSTISTTSLSSWPAVRRVSRRAKHEAALASSSSRRAACASWSTVTQRLSSDCLSSQTGMITAAALTSPRLQPPVTRASGRPGTLP
jgi:hypothetical protein